MEAGEKLAAVVAVKVFEEDKFIVMGTRGGVVKKTQLSAFRYPRAGGIIAMGVEDDDAVIDVQLTDGTAEIFLGTRDGMAIRFPESEVRRPAGARRQGISLRGGRGRAMEVVGRGHPADRLRERFRQENRP
jgi:DNA gyrase subunit A